MLTLIKLGYLLCSMQHNVIIKIKKAMSNIAAIHPTTIKMSERDSPA